MFLDRSWVRARLDLMKIYVEGLKELKRRGRVAYDADPLLRLAGERGLHIGIECTVDVSNHMIDGYAMRDPTSYADILRIMIEEGVFDRDFGEAFLPAADLRRRLARDYDALTAEEVWESVQRYADLLDEAGRQFEKFLGMG